MLRPIEWTADDKVRFLDQTRLPGQEVWEETGDYRVVVAAIRHLAVRGAPLIGVAAAYGLALAGEDFQDAAAELLSTRPTAVNLSWAISRMSKALQGTTAPEQVRARLIEEAKRIHEEDIAANRRIGSSGAALLPADATILTHCNAGSLATGGYGTALGVIQAASESGRLRHVYVTETRPLLQGARLTAWELKRDGVPFTLVVDSSAGSLMSRGMIDAVVTGADRIAANGDVANKIGTYQLAVLAHENHVPVYIAAPISTVDLAIPGGDSIPIEERSPEEVLSVQGRHIAPTGTAAANPAFDVTPARYIRSIITENGTAEAPFGQSLLRLQTQEVAAGG